MIRRDQSHTLQVEALSSDGDGRADLDGVSVAVPGTLPGERVRVNIVAQSRHHPRAYATLLEIEKPSPHRREAACGHHGDCHGCAWMMTDEGAQREAKREMLRREFGLAVAEVVPAPESWGYRWSSKRVVGGRRGALRLGSYRRRSHELASMSHCLVDHPAIAEAARELEQVASELRIEPFDETTGEGQLRYAWIKANGAGEVLLTLITAKDSPQMDALAAALKLPIGVACCVQDQASNALRGTVLRHARGVEAIVVELLGQSVSVGPLGFLQPNPAVATLAYRELLEPATVVDSGLAYDLYAGMGVTTVALREQFAQVRACESFPESAARLDIEAQTAEDFLVTALACDENPAFVVANPPRAGMGPKVCASLSQCGRRGPLALNIMSCNPKSLSADLERLTVDGGFELVSLRAFDTLPQTPHVELVARLRAGA